jgi:predicted RecB family nuclease
VTRVVYLNTLPVTQAVRHVLRKNRVYSQVLEMGIANLTALAQHIKPEVEMMVGSQVNTNTIVVAIKRLVDSIEQEKAIRKSHRAIPATNEVRMSLTDSVIDINCGLLESQDISAVLDQFFEKKDFSFNLYHTSKQFRLFADNKDAYNVIDQAITKQFRHDKEKKLSKITISFSTGQQENLNSLLFTVSNIIYSSQIEIHSAFFTSSEIVLILEDRNATELYDSLRKELTARNPSLT